jgi:CubicO group peptidase (beta-lactamase class C family)
MKKMLFFLLVPFSVVAQNLPDSMTRKIDSIFRSFTSSTPGCAVAIVKDGAVIFQKGYGQANLEYSIPIVPGTIFHIASESKQYVAFCMLLLEKEGKLSIDDDIRKYLDYVPEFGQKITIRHLIYHTSGLRDQWQLLANAGWQLDDVITQQHVVKLVSKQKTLNFTPGDEWMYCNTGYTLMAEIVKKVSGLTLREYTHKNIFQPLGMKDTHFHDNYQEIVPGRAYSYNLVPGKGFQHAVLSYSIVGATSLFTTVLDEAKWLNNYETGAVGGKDLIEKMYQLGSLNDGRKLTYAFGLNIGKHKGWKQIGHGGGDAGFRTFACRFPEKKLGIVVFSNSGLTNPLGLTNQVADVLIRDIKEEQKAPEQTLFADSTFNKKLQGRYYSERGDVIEMIWQNSKLLGRNTTSGSTSEIKMSESGNNRYSIPGDRVLILDEKSKSTDSINQFKIESSLNTIAFKRQPTMPQKISTEFVGKYYNDEIEGAYYVTEKSGELTLAHRKHANVPLKNIAPDQFTSPQWWMNHIRFIRDKKGKITAFEVNSGRVLHLRFDREPEKKM